MLSTKLRRAAARLAAVLGLAFGLAHAAAAESRVDLVPVSLSYAKGLDDDVSLSYSQHVALVIKNLGNVAWHNPALTMRVLIDGAAYSASIYGPVSTYWQLGAPIAPGQQGLVQFSLPLGTLKHCQRRSIRIDALQTNQAGSGVFANDTLAMFTVDRSSIRACVGGVISRGRTLDLDDELEVDQE
jgi:hypothetical protein